MLERIAVLCGAMVVAAALVLPCPAADSWRAGVAKAKITPTEPMWMAGYGSRNHPATGKINDLWARTLVLEDPRGMRVVLVSLDLVGIAPDVAQPLVSKLTSKFGLQRAQLALCCSHTHSGPAVGRNLHVLHYDLVDSEQQRLIDAYASQLQTTVVDAVGQAIAGLQACQLSWGQTKANFAVNRRNNREPDAPRLRAEGKLRGPVDHDVPVLRIDDRAGNLFAILFGYACHATVLDGYEWSSDYPGFAAAELEEHQPGTTALFFAGCGADQNPLPRRDVKLARQYGHELAEVVAALCQRQLKPLVGNLSVEWTEIPLPLLSVPSTTELEQDAKSSDRFAASRAAGFLKLLAAGGKIPKSYPYPIEIWRLGDRLRLILLGGEVVVDYALRLKQEYGADRTWVAAYANDVMAYIPSRRVLAEGGYEGAGAMIYYGLPSTWTPTVEESIIAAVRSLIRTSP